MMFWCCEKINLSGWGETAFPRASQFLEMQRAQCMPLVYKLTRPELCLHCLAWAPQEAVFLCLKHPRARFQTARGYRFSLEPIGMIQAS